MIEVHDVFPTKFFSYKIEDKELLRNIYDEVYSKKDQIKSISWANEYQNSDVCATDYSNRLSIESFSTASEILNQKLNQIGFSFELDEYWTALYKKIAIHPMHNHREKIFHRCNYSGILYLTNSGSTDFFTNNPSSFDNNISIISESGRFVLFPSVLPHQVVTNLDSDVERCVIAFNGVLKQL